MFNRLQSAFSDEVPTVANGQGRDPQIRLVILWIAMVAPVLMVWGRVARLQLGLQDAYVAGLSVMSESFEEIPARDGRIIAADGSLLATDLQQYSIAVHYPAIQDPPDDDWITGRAKQRLSKSDRRNKEKLAHEKEKVIAENERLWVLLADLTNRPLDEVLESRRKVQTRVQQIKASVLRRHRERQAIADAAADRNEAAASSIVSIAMARLQRAFTEPPRRSRGPRLITEELDYCTVITDITFDMKEEIEAHLQRYPSTRVTTLNRRTYPQGELASHLIGVRKSLSEEDLQERRKKYPGGDPQEYHVNDTCGLIGLERSYDVHLKGVRGQRAIIRDRRGEIINTRVVREPRHGRDLALTLNTEVQRHAEQLLDAALTKVTPAGTVDADATHAGHSVPSCPQGGCLVAIDVNTGAIIAAASAPRFDLNLLVSPDAERWADAMADPRSPFLSRATQMALPPGSVFKVISAVASIESGKMPPDTTFHCRGYLDDPNHYRCLPFRHQRVGHSDVTLADALCRSCNVYFFTAARRMGPQELVNWSRQFGIGQPTGIDLPNESSGNLPAPDLPSSGKQKQSRWKPGDTLGMAIGQASLTVTPLQMARVMAAIANGGELVTPHLAANSGPSSMADSASIRGAIPMTEPRPISGLHQDTLDHVREGLTMVVHDPKGTGYKTVRRKDVTIAGKTGTAETGNGVDHAWFAGYVPAERPRIAFVVVLQHGGSGGKAAGPVAHDFIKVLLDAGLVAKPAQFTDHSIERPQDSNVVTDMSSRNPASRLKH